MKKLTRFIFFIVPFLISGCGFYNPNLRNSPMLTKAGEVQGSGHFHVGRGFEAQGAVAITNHIGVIANYTHRKNGRPDNGEFERRTFVEGGIGYFRNKGLTSFEIFAGYGEGNVALLNQSGIGHGSPHSQTGRINRFFIQPAYIERGKTFSVSVVPRLSYVGALRYEHSGETFESFRPGWYFEPAGVGHVKLHRNIFFTFQGGLSVRLGKQGQEYPFLQTGAGLGFRFNAEEYHH